MHSIEILTPDGVSRFKLPTALHELNPKQLSGFLATVFVPSENDRELRERVLLAMVGNKHKKQFDALSEVQFLALLDLLKWVPAQLEKAEPIPTEFTIDGVVYQGPQPEGSSSVLVEFVFADAYFELVPDDPEKVCHLAACLYRPTLKKKGKDKRDKFDTDDLDERAAIFAEKMPIEYKVSTVYFMRAWKEHMHAQYKQLFENIVEDDGQGSSFDWNNAMLNIAESGVFGTLEEVKYANVHEIFMFLVKKEIDYLRALATNRNTTPTE